MTARKMSAALTAIFLGTAAIGAISVALTMPAQAAVSRAFSVPIKEAQTLVAAGNYKAASAKVNDAAALAKSPEENKIVSQMKDYIASKSGDASTPIGAQAKFAQDFEANKLKDVIDDGAILKKFGKLDAKSELVVAQSYLRLNNSQGCMNYIKHSSSGGGSEDMLQTLQRCAFDAGDNATQRDALEQLVARTGKANYWADLLKLTQNAKGVNDHNTLDIYRLKLLTGAINVDPAKAGDECSTLAKLALQFRFAAESQAVLEKCIASKSLTADARNNRLLAMAKDQAGANAAGQAKALAAAKGDDLIQIGEDQVGQGKAKEAAATIKSGIDKGAKDTASAQLRLGAAQLAAGQKADAVKTLNAVKGDDNVVMIAHLYALSAKH